MSYEFQKLRERSKSGELMNGYAGCMRYNLGTHKKVRLKKAGLERSATLLHDHVAKRHAALLSRELIKRAAQVGKGVDCRLRFMTVLEAVVEPDKESALEAVASLEYKMVKMLEPLGLWSRGVIELEMVNLDLLARISTGKDDEARKLNVLTSLLPEVEHQGLMIPSDKAESRVLVHCHVVVDLGEDHERSEQRLREKVAKEPDWNRTKYQVEIKNLFENKALSRNLSDIAAYVTKGGNEKLRFNAGFGRDLAGDLDAKIWREGMGFAKHGAETVEDERGLTIGEVRQLDNLYRCLMGRRSDNRGYLLATSGY